MNRQVEVVIELPSREEKTYMMSEFDLNMLLNCNEILWPDHSPDEFVFVTCERAHFSSNGSLEKVWALMLTTLQQSVERDVLFPEPPLRA